MLADLALAYGIQAFVYSSAFLAHPRHDDQQKLSYNAKNLVENHVMSLGSKGLPWVYVQ